MLAHMCVFGIIDESHLNNSQEFILNRISIKTKIMRYSDMSPNTCINYQVLHNKLSQH